MPARIAAAIPISRKTSSLGVWASVPMETPRAFGGDNAEPVDVEVLSVWIGIDLERRSGLDRMTADPLPIAGEASPEVVDAPPGMREHRHVRVLEATEIRARS